MKATEIQSNPTKITCKIHIDQGDPGDEWDVVVETEDGTQLKLPKVFKIIKSDDASLAAGTPTIQKPDPAEGKPEQELTLTVPGSGIKSAKAVRLTRGNETMEATIVTREDDKVVCTLKINEGKPGEKWNVVVETEGAEPATFNEVFAMVAPPRRCRNADPEDPGSSTVRRTRSRGQDI